MKLENMFYFKNQNPHDFAVVDLSHMQVTQVEQIRSGSYWKNIF